MLRTKLFEINSCQKYPLLKESCATGNVCQPSVIHSKNETRLIVIQCSHSCNSEYVIFKYGGQRVKPTLFIGLDLKCTCDFLGHSTFSYFFTLSLANSSTSILSQVLLVRYLIMDLPNSRMRPDWAATDWCRTLQSRYRRTYRENCSMMKDVYWLLTHHTSLPIIDTADEAMQTSWFSHGFDLERAFIAAPLFDVSSPFRWIEHTPGS